MGDNGAVQYGRTNLPAGRRATAAGTWGPAVLERLDQFRGRRRSRGYAARRGGAVTVTRQVREAGEQDGGYRVGRKDDGTALGT